MDIKEIISSAPEAAGVYLMKGKEGHIIYVGKARSLRKRISSYFSSLSRFSSKTLNLVNNIDSIEYIKTANEAAALLLENALIKKYQPKYNISLKDDKSYPAIIITKESSPRVFIGRPAIKPQRGKPYRQKSDFKYYGPYPDATLLREAFKILRRIFKFRTCKSLPKKACLYHKLNLCLAPCINKKVNYRRIIDNISLFLEGRYDDLIELLTKKMFRAAKLRHFEDAKELRDEITALGSLFNLEDRAQDELVSLKKILGLKNMPSRIEAFDISSIGQDFKVGSLVSFYNGLADKSNYRRFRIKQVLGIDDYTCLKEVLLRRYSRLIREKVSLPDLIVIDGGKGHLSIALGVMKEFKLDIPVISIAKENEIIFTPNHLDGIVLGRDSGALRLIQIIRDEAHRFAHKYNLLLRKKYLIK